jgi:hypothetical protein
MLKGYEPTLEHTLDHLQANVPLRIGKSTVSPQLSTWGQADHRFQVLQLVCLSYTIERYRQT